MDGENVLKEGISLYNGGSYQDALAFFASLPDDCDVDSEELAYYLGLCCFKLGRYDDAMTCLEQVVTTFYDKNDYSRDDRVLQCRYILAVIYCLTGRKNLADFELKKLLETGYRPSSVYSSLAYLYWQQGKTDICLDYYEKALQEDDQNATALNGIGYVLACQGEDLTRALTCCKKALSSRPDSAACLDSVGWVYFKLGLYSEAGKFLRQAAAADMANPTISSHLLELQRAQQE